MAFAPPPTEFKVIDSNAKDGPTPLLIVLKRRQQLVLTVFAATLASATILTLAQRLLTPQYQGSFRLLVSDPINKDTPEPASSPSVENLVIRPLNSARTPDLVEVLKSPLLLQPLARRFDLKTTQLENALTIKTPTRQVEGVLNVTLRWHNPRQGQRILKALSQAYLDYSLLERQEKLRQGLAFLDQQAPTLQRRVAALQQTLSTFRRQHQFLEPTKRGEAIQAQRERLDNRNEELQQRRAQLLGMARAVRSGQLSGPSFQEPGRPKVFGNTELPLAGGAFSPLLADLTNVEKQLAEAEATYSRNSPVVRSLRARQAKLRPLLQQRELDAITAAMLETQAQELQIRRQQQLLERDFANQPALIKQYDAIQQQLDVAKDNLTAYIKARENFRLEVAQKILPWQLIAPPQFSPQPVSPDLSRNLVLALLMGGVAGSGAAVLRERLDPLVHNSRDLDRELQHLLLGSIATLPRQADAPLAAAMAALDPDAQHRFQESLRSLATHLQQRLRQQGTPLLGFSASSSGEGSSTTALLVAQTLAELGQRVLLIDADLRKPSLHAAAGINNAAGLSTLLSDPGCTLAAVIQRLPNGLELMTAGPRPRDSTRLVSSERCQQLLQQWSQPGTHDLVLIDLPDLMERSDAQVLHTLIDCCVVVVGLGVAQGLRLQQLLHRLNHQDTAVLGLITTELGIEQEPLLPSTGLPWRALLQRLERLP